MEIVTRFAAAAGIAIFASGMILTTAADRVHAASATLNPYALGGANTTSTGTRPANNIPSGGVGSKNTPAAAPATTPAAASASGAPTHAATTPAPSTASAVGTVLPPGVNIVRDHRPGGDADPCLKPNNKCSQLDRYNSVVELRKKRPDLMGLDGDPCMRKDICTRQQQLESLIARFEKNIPRGWCDDRIQGQGCAQKWVFLNASGGKTEFVLHYTGKDGPIIASDRQMVLNFLNHILSDPAPGGGTVQVPKPSTALKQK